LRKKEHQRVIGLVRETDPQVVLKVAGICDGHTIFDPKAFFDAGLHPDIVASVTITHRSDTSHPKSTIFKEDRALTEVTGVYGLRLLEFLASALEIDYRRCMGRGFQASAIKQALHDYFQKPQQDRQGGEKETAS
jgi:hypothetical protein